MKTRPLTTEEFWEGCLKAILECRKAGYTDTEDELSQQFMKVYLSMNPALGCCIGR